MRWYCISDLLLNMDFERWRKRKTKALNDGDLAQLIVCCKELADCHVFNEKYYDALEEYRQMERAADAVHSEMDVARANRMIGEMYCEIGDFDKAIAHQQRHLDIARNQNDKVEQQRALATLGRTYFMMSDSFREGDNQKRTTALSEAKQYFTDSLATCEQLTDAMVGSKQRMEMRARLFLNLGLVHDDEGHVDSAVDYINKAVFICKKVDLLEDLFKAYIGLGCTYNKNNMKKEAISTFDKAISVAERLSTKVVSLCEVLTHKAEALLDLPDFRGACQALLRAYKLRCPSSAIKEEIERKLRTVAAMCETEVKLTDLAPEGQEGERKKLYESLGDMASELRSFEVALTYYTLMLQCVEKCGGDSKALIECYVSLAQTYKDAKQYKKAVDYFRKEVALEKGNYEESCKTYLNIAELYHLMGKNSNAMEAYKAAKFNAEACHNSRLMKTVLGNMVQHFKELGDFQEAENIKMEMAEMELRDSSDDDDDDEGLDKSLSGFGAHINLDELSDHEMDSQDEEVNTKISRSRAKPRSNIHKKNELGETPLHRAAITGNFALATKLLDQGHSVDVRDYSGWTPLHEAANHGFYDIVELLLKKGAAVNDRGGSECNGVTPLLDAASCGHFDVMELLLQHKASPLMKNNDGSSILDLMSEWKNYAEREDGTLDPDVLTKYEAMYSKLQQILERAGYKPSQKRSTTTPVKDNLTLRRTTTRNVLYEEEEDNDLSVGMPGVQIDDEGHSYSSKSVCRNSHKVGGASEYESAMRAIRFRSNDHGSSSLQVEPKIPALIPADESVSDDWLEEDVVRPNKKRKTNEFLGEPRRRRISDGSPKCHLSPSPPHPEALLPDSSNDEVVRSDPSPVHPDYCLSDRNSPSTSGSCSNKLKVMNLSRRREMRLTCSVSQEKTGKTDVDVPLNEPPQAPTSSSMICIRILVEGKLLLVPVPSHNNGLNIEWLADETAKRYKCLEGVEPKLRLMTADGAILLNSDPVSLISSLGDLQGQVLSWNLPSLVGAYKELCYNNNLSQDSSVVAIFEACPATSSADFSDTYMDSRHLMCALRILSRHHPLQCLNLSDNNIPDQNLKELSGNLVKLPQLRYLNLSSINLTCEGLTIFTQAVTEHQGLQRLETLDLGFNPLGDCLKALGDLINHLPALTSLKIPSVGLTTQSFRAHLDFTLDTLESINLSYNEIGTGGVVDILGRLNPRRVQELLLPHTGGKTIREVGLYLQMNAPPSLRSLDLSYCPASEDDMQEFIQGLEMCSHLEKLSLEGVAGLGQKNVDDLMSSRNVRELNLAGSVEVQQPLQMVEHLATLAISSCADQSWAAKGPYGFCSTTTL